MLRISKSRKIGAHPQTLKMVHCLQFALNLPKVNETPKHRFDLFDTEQMIHDESFNTTINQ